MKKQLLFTATLALASAAAWAAPEAFTNPVGTDLEWDVTACCQETKGESNGANGLIGFLTDGNTGNYWHSAYESASAVAPHTGHHYLVFDLKQTKTLTGFNWVARTTSPGSDTHGLLRGWEIYVADNAADLQFADNAAMEAYRAANAPVATGSSNVTYTNNVESYDFAVPAKAQHVLFVATEVGAKGSWISNNYEYLHCCEFTFFADDAAAAEPEAPYYRLVLANASVPADRKDLCIGLLGEGNASLNANGQSAANGVQTGRLWSQNKAEDDSEYLDYQYWRMEEDPDNAGHYAMVNKTCPAGSVKGTPTEQSNNGFWEYDYEAKHYEFFYAEGTNYNGVTDDGIEYHVISSTGLQNPDGANKYMQGAASGKNYRIMVWNDPLDGFGGQWYFMDSTAPATEPEPIEPEPSEEITITVDKANGTLSRDGDSSQNWCNIWQSTAEPGAKLQCGKNDMSWAGSEIINAAPGQSQSDTYTVYSTSADYYVKSYSFDIALTSSASVTLSGNGNTLTLTTEAQHWEAVNEGTAAMQFTLAGANTTSTLSNFVIILAPMPEVEPGEPEPTTYYCTFEANRKAGWGSYLQDANEPVQGSSHSSTLSGSDDLNINCVWKVTPGNAEGSVHVQNFITGKYLVQLANSNDQTLDEPVDIWFHDFTYNGLNGIQIATGATISNNCIDQDNHDRLCGFWQNDAGDLWFKSVMDETSPRAIYEKFGVEPPHTYVTFEANRKQNGNKRWGTYLQDASAPVKGTYGESTLCGTDDLTKNCVWELLPGSVDGAYHVQNFATGKYLVSLAANNDQTLDEPVDIWFHDFTYNGLSGIQIATGAEINSNCIDQDNHDNLCGFWQNDAGDLWFKALLDEVTPEQVNERFGNTSVDQSVVEAYTARLDEIAALVAKYLESVPFASDAVKNLVNIDALKASAETDLEGITSADGAVAKANELALTPFETALAAELTANAGDYAWYFYNVDRKTYMLASEVNNANLGFASTPGINAGNMFTFADGQLYSLARGLYAGTNSNGYGRVCNNNTTNNNRKINISLGLKDGYVQLTTVNVNGAAGVLAYKEGRNYVENLADNTLATSHWQVTRLNVTEFAESFASLVSMWGDAVPGGKSIAEKAVSDINAATTVMDASNVGVKASADLLAALTTATDKPFSLKNVGNQQYLGYEFGWYTQAEKAENTTWALISNTTDESMQRYALKNISSDKCMLMTTAYTITETTDPGAVAAGFVISLNLQGYVTVRGGRVTTNGDTAYNYVLAAKEDGSIYLLDLTLDFHNTPTGKAGYWQFAYAEESEEPAINQEILDAIKAKMADAESLAEQYKKSVPFAADDIDNVVGYLADYTPEQIYEALAASGGLDSYEDFFTQMVNVPLEEAVVESLNANAEKLWTLYNPTQEAYLCAEPKATNQGYDSFNYQDEVSNIGYWKLEAMGKYYLLQSAMGQYIGTPKVHYCRVEDDYDEAGIFTLGVKDGYVIFASGSHDGYGLGLDGQNDPAEIMSLSDACLGYRWMVDIYTGEPWVGINDVNAAIDESTVIYDLQGRRVNKVSTGLYIINGVKTLVR